MIRIPIAIVLVFSASGCGFWSSSSSESSKALAYFNELCSSSSYELTIPISIFEGIFWIPSYYVYSSGSSYNAVPAFVSGCPTYDIDNYDTRNSGMIEIGGRGSCEICEPDGAQVLKGREVEYFETSGVQVRVIEATVDGESVKSVVIFDEQQYLHILNSSNDFWRASLEELGRFRREIDFRSGQN